MASIATVFKWPVVKFSKVASHKGTNSPTKSEKFTLTGTKIKLYLAFYPNNCKKNFSREYSSVYLRVKDFAGEESVLLRYKLWFENCVGQRIEAVFTHTFDKTYKSWGWHRFVHQDRLYSLNDDFVKNDCIFIGCEVSRIQSKLDNLLSKEVNLQLRNQLYSSIEHDEQDICILRAGDQEFKVNKSVLFTHSAVFEQMFSSGMQETQTRTFVIQNTKPEAVNAFIKYLYVLKVDFLDSLAEDLFEMSNKYRVRALVDLCADKLSENLDASNAFRRLKLAFTYGNAELKQSTLDFVTLHNREGNFREIQKSPEWLQLMNSNNDLSMQIMDAVYEKTNFLG